MPPRMVFLRSPFAKTILQTFSEVHSRQLLSSTAICVQRMPPVTIVSNLTQMCLNRIDPLRSAVTPPPFVQKHKFQMVLCVFI